MMSDSQFYYRNCAGENRMVDTEAIARKLQEKGITYQQFAELLGVSHHTVKNRMRWGNWTVLEAWRVCQILEIDIGVFFAFPERVA